MAQRLARIGFDRLDFRLATGEEFIFESAPVFTISDVGDGRRADITGVCPIAREAGAGVGGRTIRGKAVALGIAAGINFVVPIDAIDRVVRDELANDADDVFLDVGRTHIEEIISIERHDGIGFAVAPSDHEPFGMSGQSGITSRWKCG